MKRIGLFLGLSLVLVFATASTSLLMADDGKWLVRSRLIVIQPNDDADGDLATLNAEVEDDITVEVDATYFVTPRFGIEGILATAAQEVETESGGVETSLGAINHAPATFLAQYHFKPDGKTRPYVGAGVNYTIFYGESGALTDFDLDSGSFGLAGQVGVDFMLGDSNKSFNLDLKYIDIDIEVESGGSSLGTADINPLVFGVGFGVRF